MTDKIHYQAVQTHTLAVLCLVLGILGLTQVLPLVGPIGAIISGKMAEKEIRERPDLYSGGNIAQTGVILGWIGIGLFGLGLLLVVLAISFFMPVSTIRTPY
jgi:hypothetical protein